MLEVWKDIPDYKGLYQISTLGRVKSLPRNGVGKTEKMLSIATNRYGYCKVVLHKNGISKNYFVHRLVAMAFIDNNNPNMCCVNHKDENKSNNRLDNLEWCSVAYNNSYGSRTQKTRKKVLQIDPKNNIVKVWDGIRVASRATGITSQQISQCCNGTKYRKTAGGYI